MKKEIVDGKIVIRISIFWLFALAVVIVLFVSFFRNYIFATNTYNIKLNKQLKSENNIKIELEKVNVEKNENAVDILNLMVQNNYSNKKLVNEQRKVEYETIYVDDEEIAKGEKEVYREGEDGKKQVTVLQTYDGDKQVLEEIIETVVIEEPVTEIIHVGTSEKLAKYNADVKRIEEIKKRFSRDMDLSKKSDLTLEDYKYIFKNCVFDSNNVFLDSAEYFYNAEQKYSVNGIFLASIGIHESGWGTSYLAKEKKNLFGYMAYDRDPINSAASFDSYEYGIDTVARVLSKYYLDEDGSYYNGKTIDAVNKRYATSETWGDNIYWTMEYLYGKLEASI